jgi:uncharacterized membrane protein (UPF0127 family)
MIKKSILIVMGSIVVFCSIICAFLPNHCGYISANDKRHCIITIVNTLNEKIQCNVEIAITDKEHETGLMNRSALCDDCGMLFVFSDEGYRTFWMKNTSIPLSIAFIDANGIINDIHDMNPFQTFPEYSSKYPAQYALEVNHGWFKNKLISVGSRVMIHGCISK